MRSEPLRFVILSLSRSGSTLLTRLLDSHPDIFAAGELFNYEARGYRAYTARGRDWLRDPVRSCERFFATHAGHRAVGFKLLLGQNPGLRRALVGDSRVRKIVLVRRNFVARYTSLLETRRSGMFVEEPGFYRAALLRRLGVLVDGLRERDPGRVRRALGRLRQWVAHAPSRLLGRVPPPLRIAPGELEAAFARARAAYRGLWEELAEAGETPSVLVYERLQRDRDRVMDELQRGLEVAPRRLVSTSRPVARRPLEARIANLAELRAALGGSLLGRMLDGAEIPDWTRG